ncbi:MAG: hypothetical protein ACI33N_07830, partial [Desulfovibrionaceae bacterium]
GPTSVLRVCSFPPLALLCFPACRFPIPCHAGTAAYLHAMQLYKAGFEHSHCKQLFLLIKKQIESLSCTW